MASQTTSLGLRAAPDPPTAPLTSRSLTRRREPKAVAARAHAPSRWFPIFVGLVHLAIVQTAATLAYRYGTIRESSAPFRGSYGGHELGAIRDSPPLSDLAEWIVAPLRLWDGLWYQLVAERGYDFHSANAAFWPLFPWSMRALAELLPITTATAGYLIANVSFFVALVLLYRLVALDFDEGIARATLWAIALFPTALFFSAVYTESPFLMLIVGSLYAAKRGKWLLAGIVGALAALTRSYGVFLILPLAVLFIQERGFYLRRLIPAGLAVLMPVLGPVIFTATLENRWEGKWTRAWLEAKRDQLRDDPVDFLKVIVRWPTKEPLWISVQEQWNRYSAMPWETLQYAFSRSPEGERIRIQDGADWSWLRALFDNLTWETITSPAWRDHVANSDTLELVCTLLFLALSMIGIAKLPLYMSAFLIPGPIVPLFQPSSVHALMSMPRFGLTLFPLFVVIALLLRGQAWLGVPLALLSTALLVLLTIQFSTWYWVS